MPSPAISSAPALLFGQFDPTDWQGPTAYVQAYAAMDKLLGKKLSITAPQNSFIKQKNPDGTLQYLPFPRNRMEADRTAGRYSMLTWMAMNLTAKADTSVNLRSIVSGTHDAYITQWAKDAAAWGHPFICRLNPEMNGWWFNAASEQDKNGLAANGNQIGDYVKSWQRIVDICNANGATNVTWYWCANVLSTAPKSPQPTAPEKLAGFYPGDKYVHLVGSDIYNWSVAQGASNAWMSYAQITGPIWAAITKLAPNKRRFIGEMGCHNVGGDAAAWWTDALASMAADPLMVGFIQFNWLLPPSNWLITASSAITAAFAAGVASPSYLAGGSFPFGDDKQPVPAYALASTPDKDILITTSQSDLAKSQQLLQSIKADADAAKSDLDTLQAAHAAAQADLAAAQSTIVEKQAAIEHVEGLIRDRKAAQEAEDSAVT